MREIDPSDHIIIDRRPIWIVIFDRMRRAILLAVLFTVFAVLLNQEGPADLSPEAYKVLCVFFLSVSLWSTNLIPLSVTSLLAMAMIPLLGIMNASEVYAFFGNKAVFFILGVFILSAAMIGCGMSARMSLWVLDNWGHSPRKLITSIYLFGAVSSCFMSEHAVAAMLFPIVFEVVKALGLAKKESRFTKGLFFALAWGCIIGGAATVFGGGRVPLAMEILEKSTDGAASIGILEYTVWALPLFLLLLGAGWALLMWLFPPEISDVGPARRLLHKKSLSLGKVTLREKGIAVVMILTLLVWFTHGESLGIANIAILSIVLLFVFNLVTWRMVETHVNWAIILMYGGAICLGQVMADSGAAQWLAQKVFEGTIQSGGVFLIVIALLSMLFTTFMNNSAVIAILVPPAISLAPDYGISATLVTMTVILPSNFAFILPIATPASALAYSSRLIPLREMMRSGLLLGLLGMLCYSFCLFVYWPLLGLK